MAIFNDSKLRTMKKLLLIGLCLALFHNSFAQEEPQPHKNSFHLSFLPLIVNTFQVGYERQIGKNSILLSPRFIYKDNVSTSSGIKYGYDATGVGGELQYRISLGGNSVPNKDDGKALRQTDFYFAPFATTDFISTKNYSVEQVLDSTNGYMSFYHDEQVTTGNSINSYSGGVLFGMKLFLNSRLFVDGYGGAGFRKSYGNRSYNIYGGGNLFGVGYSGILLKGGIQVGFTF